MINITAVLHENGNDKQIIWNFMYFQDGKKSTMQPFKKWRLLFQHDIKGINSTGNNVSSVFIAREVLYFKNKNELSSSFVLFC